jgi:hypothetical protein
VPHVWSRKHAITSEEHRSFGLCIKRGKGGKLGAAASLEMERTVDMMILWVIKKVKLRG